VRDALGVNQAKSIAHRVRSYQIRGLVIGMTNDFCESLLVAAPRSRRSAPCRFPAASSNLPWLVATGQFPRLRQGTYMPDTCS